MVSLSDHEGTFRALLGCDVGGGVLEAHGKKDERHVVLGAMSDHTGAGFVDALNAAGKAVRWLR